MQPLNSGVKQQQPQRIHAANAHPIQNGHDNGSEVTTGIPMGVQAHSPTLSLPPQAASLTQNVAHVTFHPDTQGGHAQGWYTVLGSLH